MPIEFGFDSQEIAEETMKAAFNSIIEKNPKKKENLHKLCIQTEEFAKLVYKKEIEEGMQNKMGEENKEEKEFTFGEFCKNFELSENEQQKISHSEAQSSADAAVIQEN